MFAKALKGIGHGSVVPNGRLSRRHVVTQPKPVAKEKGSQDVNLMRFAHGGAKEELEGMQTYRALVGRALQLRDRIVEKAS
jgi:hypothetical protein